MDSLRLNFWLPAVIDSGESIFQKLKYEYLNENSEKFEIAFRHVYKEQNTSYDEKKGSQKISLDCPFNNWQTLFQAPSPDLSNLTVQ